MPGELREHQGDPNSKMLLLGKGLNFDSFLSLFRPHISSLAKSGQLSSKTSLELIYTFFVHDHPNSNPCCLSLPSLQQEPFSSPFVNSNHISPMLEILQEFPIAL